MGYPDILPGTISVSRPTKRRSAGFDDLHSCMETTHPLYLNAFLFASIVCLFLFAFLTRGHYPSKAKRSPLCPFNVSLVSNGLISASDELVDLLVFRHGQQRERIPSSHRDFNDREILTRIIPQSTKFMPSGQLRRRRSSNSRRIFRDGL